VADLVRLIKGMAQVRVVRRRREPGAPVQLTAPQDTVATPRTPEIVAIGASTGGPQALQEILLRLPHSFPLPVVVVQHTTLGYSNTLVDWLIGATGLPVRLAEDGQALDRGGVFVAPTGRHVIVQGRRMALVDAPPVSLHCPSATLLFKSVAAAYGAHAIGVLLTGMGDDGATGLMEMKRAGALTLAQDEGSSVVFGMPGEAIRIGAVDHILPPDRIADVLLEQLAVPGGGAWT
jgi:two-component system chemotaxis response regulator CheB